MAENRGRVRARSAKSSKSTPQVRVSELEAIPEAPPESPTIWTLEQPVHWGWAVAGLGACFLIVRFILPSFPTLGFLGLGVATLAAGYALGRA